MGRIADLADQVRHLLDPGHEVDHRAAGLIHEFGAARHRLGTGADQGLDLARGLR